MSDVEAKCWICSSSGPLSGEHLPKASNIRDFFGKISPDKPVYLTTIERDARPIHSAKSDKLKTRDVICIPCNTARSQQFDDAWMMLSRELRKRLPTLRDGQKLRGNAVFPYDTRRELLAVHLFFVKVLGCHLAAAGISEFDLASLANAIMNERAHPGLFLQIGFGVTMNGALHMGTSGFEKHATATGVKFGIWCYSVGGYSVMVALVDYNQPTVPNDWCPKGW